MPNTALHPPQQGLQNATNRPQQQQQQQQQLRRAVYIHVSDLTNAYNIDHARLEEELARVNKIRETAAVPAQQNPMNNPNHPNNPAAVATRVGIPTELDTSLSQKRLQPPRGGFNLCVLVGDVNVVVDKGRVDGSRVRLAEVEVGDETGTVSLRARDEQIDILREVSVRSGAVVLRNCTLELYQGKHIRLAVTKWGKLCTYPDQVASTPPPPSKMNPERNFSLIDLSLVASEMVVFPQTTTNTEQGHNPYGQPLLQEGGPPNQNTGGASNNNTNRQPSFQAGPTAARRGTGRRPAQRGRVAPQVQNNLMPAHYGGGGEQGGGIVPTMRYQGGMHPYSGGYGEAQPYSYPQQRQQQQQQGQQHMMMQQHQQHQQQYEMQQHRQMQQHQQMYQRAPAHSPNFNGIPAVSAAGSFDTAYSSESMHIPVPNLLGGSNLNNQFMMPISGTHGPGGQSPPSAGMHYSPANPPMSPGQMNPQAATFDPTGGGNGGGSNQRK